MKLKYRPVDARNIPEEPDYSFGRVMDVSERGICVEVDRALRIGEKLEVYASTGRKAQGMYGIARVVWIVRRTDHFEAGFVFEKWDWL